MKRARKIRGAEITDFTNTLIAASLATGKLVILEKKYAVALPASVAQIKAQSAAPAPVLSDEDVDRVWKRVKG